jgi:hypothetical protein
MNGYISDYYAEPQGRITIKNGFEDVQDPDKYYYEPVYWAYDHEPQVTSGTDETHFSPKALCNRGQVVTFIWRALGKPEPDLNDNPFVDLKEGSSYYEAVLWAYQNGVTSGIDATHFAPKQSCTRAQVVTFLWRAAGAPDPSDDGDPFSDVDPEAYYYKAVLWAVEKGITNGTSAGAFSPDSTCTRAQIVTFLFRAQVE